jgi:DNA-binding transcriptional LysR family regulator
VSTSDDDRLVRLLETGAVDLAVIRTPGAGLTVDVRPAAMCTYAAAIPAASSLARTQKRVALADLGTFARIATADGTAFADDVAAPVVASDAEMALGLVAAGAGAAVLPSLFASAPPGAVAIRPLRDILPPFSLSLATAGELVPQAADLCDLLVAAIAGWPNAGSAGTDAAAPA